MSLYCRSEKNLKFNAKRKSSICVHEIFYWHHITVSVICAFKDLSNTDLQNIFVIQIEQGVFFGFS